MQSVIYKLLGSQSAEAQQITVAAQQMKTHFRVAA